MLKKKVLCGLLVGVSLLTGCQTTLEQESPPDVEQSVHETIPIDAVIASSALQYPATNDLFYYNVYDDYIAITKYLGDENLVKEDGEFVTPTDIKIPDMIDGLPVYIIGPGAFNGAAIESVAISKNVVQIGANAFSNCPNLRKVTFTDITETSESVTEGNGAVSIGSSAFKNCVSLEEITLPDSVEALGEAVFSGCVELKKINLPSFVVSVPDDLCTNCEKLTEIYISDSAVEISDSAFSTVARDAKIYGGVYSQSAHYAANHFMLFVINREKKEIKVSEEGVENNVEQGQEAA